jgi:predicted enzyme related to lactoylglutathione lyase
MTDRLIFVALNVTDLDESIAFYRNAFGIEFHTDDNEPIDDPWYGGHHGAYSWHEGAFLHFALFPALLPERAVTRDAQVGFQVADIDAAHLRAASSGAALVHAPRAEPWGATARYRDPDGNLVSITQS